MKNIQENLKKICFIFLAFVIISASLLFCQPTVSPGSHASMGHHNTPSSQHGISECCRVNLELNTATKSKLDFFITLIALLLAGWQIFKSNKKTKEIRLGRVSLVNNRGPNSFKILIDFFSQGILHSKSW
ncbi:MAG: hypothetical protein WCV92_01560 [Candidatus Buchananbacteria bacterium]